jgi:shikimate 5-dehydrogenase/shikimate kinase/3-dehydroquinate dehydratase
LEGLRFRKVRILIIGHRGTGKTSLAQRLGIYLSLSNKTIPIADLDREIEKSVNQSISDIFSLMGEEQFRKLEISYLQQMIKAPSWIISVGAGLEISKIIIPKDAKILWLQRKSDKQGRVFFNRPRLNPEISPLQEFKNRYEARHPQYAKQANSYYDLPEGLGSFDEIERELFFGQPDFSQAGITLFPEHLESEHTVDQLKSFKFRFYEIRNDILNKDQIEKALSLFTDNQILFSLRNDQNIKNEYFEKFNFDCAIELEKHADPNKNKGILSMHNRDSNLSFEKLLSQFSENKKEWGHLKLAVPIYNFQELKQGLDWQNEDSQNRSFLPMSEDGRWYWVRLWLKGKQKINFCALAKPSASDQPTFYQWLATPERSSQELRFAAVLGSPVLHSYSPIEHREFFSHWKMPFWSITINADEWDEALPILEFMGLKAAAITSPLKQKAFQWVNQKDATANSLGSINTIIKSNEGWRGTNTDLEGLSQLLQSVLTHQPVFIWGGGGTLPVIQKILPHAVAWSTTTQQPRLANQHETSKLQPKTIIWAGSPQANFPPENWAPQFVVDLNYREDSRAREYAMKHNAQYVSGLQMFKVQAEEQQRFWQNTVYSGGDR